MPKAISQKRQAYTLYMKKVTPHPTTHIHTQECHRLPVCLLFTQNQQDTEAACFLFSELYRKRIFSSGSRFFLARLDEVQEELLYYPSIGVGVSVGGSNSVSKMLEFYVKGFYVMG